MPVKITLNLEIDSCMDCPCHEVVEDPEPGDSFNSDDMAVLCKRTENKKIDGWASTRWCDNKPWDHRAVAVSVRPYKLREETPVPAWCPLRT